MEHNNFCLYCTGGDRKEIDKCDDKYCPFYPFRFGDNFNEEREKELAKQILKDIGIIR